MAETSHEPLFSAIELRRRALERLGRGQDGGPAELAAGDLARLLHELEVHQVELEVQNDDLHQTQLKLAAALESYRDLFDRAPVGYLTLDGDFKILQINQTAGRLFNRDLGELKGLRVEELVQRDERDRLFRLLRTAAVSGSPEAGDFRIAQRAASGESWVRADVAPLDRPQEAVGGFRLTLTDITGRVQAEHGLRAQRERMPIGCVVFDEHGCFQELNPAAERIFGYTEAEAKGKHYGILVPEAVRPQIDALIHRLSEGDLAAHSIHENLTKDGCSIVCEWTNTPLRDAAGRYGGFLSMVRNITERRRAEEELWRSKELQQRIFEALPAHIAVVNRAGRIIAVNQAWSGFAAANGAADLPSVAVGANYLEVCRRAAMESSDPGVAQALAGIESVLDGSSELFTSEYPCHAPEEQRWFSMTVVPLGPGGEGCVVVSHLNITERRLAEEALRRSEERLRVATQAAKTFVWDCDMISGAVLWSENAAAVVGCRPEQLPQDIAQAQSFVAPEISARFLEDYESAVAAREIVFTSEFPGPEVPAKARYFQVHGRILYDAEGVPLRIFGATQDITERKLAEELIQRAAADLFQANEELTKFNRAMVGRELRMIELKKEVNELCAALGRERCYPLEFEEGSRGKGAAIVSSQ